MWSFCLNNAAVLAVIFPGEFTTDYDYECGLQDALNGKRSSIAQTTQAFVPFEAWLSRRFLSGDLNDILQHLLCGTVPLV